MSARQSYHARIESLFALLVEANTADCVEAREGWQRHQDAEQRNYFGHIANAIKAIAGDSIYDHWVESSEVNLQLANRYVPY